MNTSTSNTPVNLCPAWMGEVDNLGLLWVAILALAKKQTNENHLNSFRDELFRRQPTVRVLLFLVVQREGNFVADIPGLDGGGREDQQHARRLDQCLFDGAVPFLTRLDVELIQPHAGSGFLQVLGEPTRES